MDIGSLVQQQFDTSPDMGNPLCLIDEYCLLGSKNLVPHISTWSGKKLYIKIIIPGKIYHIKVLLLDKVSD